MGLLNGARRMLGRMGGGIADGAPLPANNPLMQRGMQMMEQRVSADDAHRAFQGGMFGAPPSPNAQALNELNQRMASRGPGYGGGDIETLKSLLFYSVPGLRNNQRLPQVKSVEELAALLDEAGADPAQWLSRVGA